MPEILLIAQEETPRGYFVFLVGFIVIAVTGLYVGYQLGC